MKFMNLLLVISVMIIGQAQATDVSGGKDRFEKRYIHDSKKLPDLKIQNALKENSAWKNFQVSNSGWYVSFDERSGMPHRATGKPIHTNAANPTAAANAFMRDKLSGFNIPFQDLKFQTENFSGKYYNVFYTQKYQGIDVLNSRVFIKIMPDMSVSTFGLDIFSISGLSTAPAIPVSAIGSFAVRDMNLQIEKISPALTKILPLPISGTYEYRLVYELTVATRDENNIPGLYYSLLDANTGELLYRQNRVRFSQPLSSDVNVIGTVSLYSPYQPTVTVPLPNLKVNNGVTIVYTDTAGLVNLPGTSPVTGTFTLAGKWSKIYTDGGSVSPSSVSSFNSGTGVISFDSLTTLSHVSGYYHVNVVHDFMKKFFPIFTSMDNPLETQIDLTSGTCNAFYSGNSINFFSTGGGCHSMAQVGDIVYHEYGHGINDKFYQWQGASWDNGGMGEGYADVWGLSITQNPILGSGYRTSGANTFIRRYDVLRKVYPQNLTGEVHDDGEIIAGAWYDVALNLGSWADMTALFASTYYDLVTGPDGSEGQVYTDILISALNHDDNDGDLSNGTPNDQAIISAFELHGITLLNSVNIVHQEVLTSAKLSPITIDASMQIQYPWYPITVKLNYRTSPTDPWTTIPMTGTGGNFTTSIPGQPSGTLIAYYVEAFDISGTSLSTNPKEAVGTDVNIPYFILVDYERQIIEDFDSNQTAGWLTSQASDNASSGFWVIEQPVASYTSGGELCQTDSQHTAVGLKCALTGNMANTSFSVGANDVDGGKTTLQSPMLDISSYTMPVISYWRWYTNDQGSAPKTDFWRTYISDDGVNFTFVEQLLVPDHQWRRFALKVEDYFPAATQIMLRFVADDAGNGSIVEAAVDDIEILDIVNQVSVNEITKVNSVKLYPNPANSEFSIAFNSSYTGSGNLEIVNAIGQIVYSENIKWLTGMNRHMVDAGSIANGVYRVLLRAETNTFVLPLSILRD